MDNRTAKHKVRRCEIETELENVDSLGLSGSKAIRSLQAVDGLCMFYLRRARFTEGLDACQEAVAAIEGAECQEERVKRSRLAARLLVWQAALSMNLERFDEAKQCLQESRHILENPHLEPPQVIEEQIFTLVIQGLLANLGLTLSLY
jgi:hypothetical protein